MELMAALVIVFGTTAVVLWPLFGPRMVRATDQHWARDRLEALLSRRDSAYDAIRDLDFEYQLGNLSQGDYRELRERYRQQAAGVLQTLDRFEGPPAAPTVAATMARAPAVTLAGSKSLPVKSPDRPRSPARQHGRAQPPPVRRHPAADTCPWCGEHVDRWAAQCRWCGGTMEETP